MSKPRVFWFMKGSRDNASSRIHGYHIHDYLLAHDFQSFIGLEPYDMATDSPVDLKLLERQKIFCAGDIVIFIKFSGPSTQSFIQWLRQHGVITIFVNSDLPLQLETAKLANWVVCPSAYLHEKYRSAGVQNVAIIDDAIEYAATKRYQEVIPLSIIWFGHMNNERLHRLEAVRKLFQESLGTAWQLKILSMHPAADIIWELDTVWDHLQEANACLVTTSVDENAMAKSANRVTQAMALGLPVVAPAIPAYEAIIEQGVNGFIYRDDTELVSIMHTLTKVELRQKVGNAAYHFAVANYTVDKIGEKWIKLLQTASTVSQPPNKNLESDNQRLRAHVHAKMATGKYGDRKFSYRWLHLRALFRSEYISPYTLRYLLNLVFHYVRLSIRKTTPMFRHD